MEMTDENIGNAKRKKIVGTMGGVFIAAMLLLTFLSSTIHNLGLIRVECEDVKAGNLVYTLEKQTASTPANIYDIFAERELRVESLLVKNGQRVEKGQLLAKFDMSDIKEEIKSKELELESRKEEKELMAYKYDLDIESGKKSAAGAEKELLAAAELQEAGAETQANVEKLRKVYETADMDYRKLLEEKASNLAIKQNEADTLRRSINALKASLKRCEALYSPVDGFLWESNVQEGAPAGTAKPVFRIAYKEGVRIQFTVSMEEGKHLTAGDTMTVSVPALHKEIAKIKISAVSPSKTENGVEVSAFIEDPELRGGEMVTISMEKESEGYDFLVPNSSVRTDSNNRKFVYVVKEKKSRLGKEYYLQKAFIAVEASDKTNTAVSSGLSFFEKVVTGSDRPVMAGDRVKLYRE
jgi:multidrug efflux pump subunit AcrA (membrane-fusion protein)